MAHPTSDHRGRQLKELASEVKKLRGWAASDESVAERLTDALNELTAQQTLLESKYESKIDLKVVQQRAEELGMSAPRDDQVIYVSLSGSDRAEIYEEEKTNILGEIIGAVEESISDLIAYLRPSAA